MSARWMLDNLAALSLQIGLVVFLAGFLPALLCLRFPRARLFGGQILLAVCLMLPLLQPWKKVVNTARPPAPAANTTLPVGFSVPPSSGRTFSWAAPVLILVVAGTMLRLAFLLIRIGRLRKYRRRSIPLEPAPSWSVEASLRVSDKVGSPVTFGWREPVVLLPASFQRLRAGVQDAILCHEVMHVRRRDWLVTVGEEVVRALLWFHPAIWWLLGEIGLAREQEVDRQAIEITGQREEYLDALLAVASLRSYGDLAPAPLFLRKRQLKRRMVAIAEGTRSPAMAPARVLAMALVLLVAAGWAGAAAFPLTSTPQPAPYSIAIEPDGVPAGKLDGVLFGAIAVNGLPDDVRKRLLARLPVHVGDPYTEYSLSWVTEAAKAFDPQLILNTRFLLMPDGGGREVLLEISAPGAHARWATPRIRVSDYLMAPNLVRRVRPVGPPAIQTGNVSGAVLLNVGIATDGTVAEVQAVRGPKDLIPPAVDAVRQWVYRPTLLGGRPVQVETAVEVVFPRK